MGWDGMGWVGGIGGHGGGLCSPGSVFVSSLISPSLTIVIALTSATVGLAAGSALVSSTEWSITVEAALPDSRE